MGSSPVEMYSHCDGLAVRIGLNGNVVKKEVVAHPIRPDPVYTALPNASQ